MTTQIRVYNGDLWELAVAPPAESLRLYVREYVAWRDATTRVVRRRHVPSGHVPLILNFDAGVRERRSGYAEWAEYESFASGLHDTSTITESTGPSRGIQIDFTALGARLFFGLPLYTLTNTSVPAHDMLGHSDDLSARLFDASDGAQQFAMLDREIAARIATARPVKKELAWA